jgi:excisionase family DNA binding protein
MTAERLLTAAEVADQLRRDAHWVNKLAATGVLAAAKVGRFWRFTQADVDEYLTRVRSQAADPMARSAASASRRRAS